MSIMHNGRFEMDSQLPLILRQYINPPGYSELSISSIWKRQYIRTPNNFFLEQTVVAHSHHLQFSISPSPNQPHPPVSPNPASTMPSLSPFLLAPSPLTNAALATTDPCTTFPSWTISNFHSNTTDSVGTGGSASFTLVNNLTNATDDLSCPLQVNYRCIFAGVPSDANLTVNVAVRAESLTLLLDESVECPGRET